VTAQVTAPDVPLTISAERKEIVCGRVTPASRATDNLLRVASGDDPQKTCTNCHAEMTNLHAIGHSAAVLRSAGFEADICGPCHVPHGRRDIIEPHFLWPKTLAFVPDADSPVRIANQHLRGLPSRRRPRRASGRRYPSASRDVQLYRPCGLRLPATVQRAR